MTDREVGDRVQCGDCKEVFAVPTKGGTGEVQIDEWAKEKVAKQCKPVLVYYYCAPITDAKNPNWVFARKLEMTCFARKDNTLLLKEQFACEKVKLSYPVKTDNGKILFNKNHPKATSWDYKVSKIVLTSFDGEKKFAEISAKQAKSPQLKSSNFTKLLKIVQAKNAKYVKDMQKRQKKERKAAEKKAAAKKNA